MWVAVRDADFLARRDEDDFVFFPEHLVYLAYCKDSMNSDKKFDSEEVDD